MVAIVLVLLTVGVGICLWWQKRNASWSLTPGEYRLSMTATRGSQRGHSTQGPLTLRITPPRAGQHPDESRYAPLYGWTDADLTNVGAPLCADGPAPAPSPRDSVFTGVLVLKLPPESVLDARVSRPKDAPILVTGTGTNIRDGGRRLDGCGIGLFVQSRGWNCLRGEWGEWGLEHDGGGTFTLCPGA
jgi:hypothetical protein